MYNHSIRLVPLLSATGLGLCLLVACEDDNSSPTNPAPSGPAPELSLPSATVQLERNVEFALPLNNRGTPPDSCRVVGGSNLPSGVTFALASDGSTCVLSGAPGATLNQTRYSLSGQNEGGASTFDLTIEVSGTSLSATCAAGQPERASYRGRFISQWSAANNGGNLPSGGHFSPLIGTTHNGNFRMWSTGSIASSGIELMAETGGTSTLRAEIARQNSTNADSLLSGSGLSSPSGTVMIDFVARCTHPRVALVSMLAPSPDWFVGVNDASLLDDNGSWRQSAEFPLRLYDAGTDSGSVFTSPNADITPHLAISRVEGDSTIGFQAGQDVVGRMVFERVLEPPELSQATHTGVVDMALTLELENSGGAPNRCRLGENQNLPSGLSVVVSDDAASCAIRGTPKARLSVTRFQIIASNDDGSSSVNVSLDIIESTDLPNLQRFAESQTFAATGNASIVFANSGGAPTTCALAEGQSLPTGLQVGLSEDGASCAISGTANEVSPAREYIVVATRAGVESRAAVNFAIVAAAANTGCPPADSNTPRMSRYRVNFITEWSQANNGGTLPGGPHFSPLVGATHNDQYTVWAPNGIASNGIEMMAELGSTGTLRDEIIPMITAQRAGNFIRRGGLPPASGSVQVVITVTCEYPLVSLVSMLAPSPDWFVGVNGVTMLDDDMQWKESASFELHVYDAGTDSGPVFTAGEADIDPHIPITRLTGNATIGFQASLGQDDIGRMEFERIDP